MENLTIKVYGKTNNQFNRYLTEKCVSMITDKKHDSHKLEFYDIDNPNIQKHLVENNIFYVPTVIIEDTDGTEVDYIENKTSFQDINLAKIWWSELESFLNIYL